MTINEKDKPKTTTEDKPEPKQAADKPEPKPEKVFRIGFGRIGKVGIV